ncbi:MAG: methyltransferase domain-containing protein [Dehalococcoidales bacterium]|nr:methyltransferase domain-containing protein [Dehalococcoidales bacterium]
MTKKITHSYEGLGAAYLNARKGSPKFAEFMVFHAGLDGSSAGSPCTIVELGVGSGQQTEYVEQELLVRGIDRYTILACDKSDAADTSDAPGQLDILRARIKIGELSERVVPLHLDFDKDPLPLEAESTDFSYMAHVIHHLNNKEKVISEVARITRRNGTFFILGVTLEDMKDHPLHEFFSTKYKYETKRYPAEPQLKEMFESAGLTFEKPFQVGSHNVRPINREFLASTEDTTIDSALMIMKNEHPSEFEEGVAKVRREVEQAEKSGDFRTYRSLSQSRVFWGKKK